MYDYQRAIDIDAEILAQLDAAIPAKQAKVDELRRVFNRDGDLLALKRYNRQAAQLVTLQEHRRLVNDRRNEVIVNNVDM